MNRFAYALPIFAGIMFGSVGVFVRTLYAAGFSNASVLFARTLLATLILLIYIGIKDFGLLKLRKKDIPWILGCSVLGMLVTNVCFNISSTNLSLAFAAVLLSIAPVYTLIISRIALGNRIALKKIICVIMTIAGCIMVSGVTDSAVVLSAPGVAAGIISGISYGLYSIFSKKGTEGGLNALTITFYCMLVVMIITAPLADYDTMINYVCAEPVKNMMFLVLHSLCVGVVPYLLLTLSMKHMNPGTATILASCEPVAAMIFGIIFFGELPGTLGLVGLAITVIALGAMCRGN